MAKKQTAPLPPHFANTLQRAALYAVAKQIDVMLKHDAKLGHEIEPGTYDVSGLTLTIKLHPGTLVSRGLGNRGDGTNEKAATTNLYGYPLLAMAAIRLQKFKMWNIVRRWIIHFAKLSVRQARRRAKDLDKWQKNALAEIDPELEQILENLKEQMRAELPVRIDDTPRNVDTELNPTFHLDWKGASMASRIQKAA